MICMKCGKEVEDNGVFCLRCREVMDRYPVEPGTVVTLPPKNRPAVRKPLPKKEPAPEDQVKRLTGIIRRLTISLICVIFALVLTLTAIFQIIFLLDTPEDNTGKNYSTMAPGDGT